eukprot:739992-Pyramimonas_sp.AAC.1
MMRGTAHKEDENNNHRSLSTRQVFLEWQVAPTAIELLVRRLSWWQSIIRSHAHHGHFLASFFGRCKFEQQAAISNRPVSAGTLNSQGEIAADPNVH